VIWKKYCGTIAKAGGNRENKLHPVVTGVPFLLENGPLSFQKLMSLSFGGECNKMDFEFGEK
jgi:hypothetical protein